eukprot:COSAG06_NODE_10672_length_1639_cov_1.001948_1_plen_66_part_10
MVRVQVVTDQLVNLGAQRRRRVASSERRHGNTKLLERDGIARVIGQPLGGIPIASHRRRDSKRPSP